MNQDKRSTQNLKETIDIHLDSNVNGGFLDKLHNHYTELAPSKYYNQNVIEVENHHTRKRYSIRGEETMDVPKRKFLKYVIEDGSTIQIEYHESSNTMTIIIDVYGETVENILDKSIEIRTKLIEAI
ncbi:hypothetical protein [Candidatus Xianfuyuplasma coldseepsis]|uniref:Uncharacterized protein n=1 Tax=Candidatus Xianfuyuplasma coldseepsis TaxID=2782163 RepID=A0A7L7KQG5_9MOLU|nr:hypothetical protein [Xianfuyuplasma coldseepsis]QMS84825.1 hypothetical protein G4Z02_03340 [Xianfuyuplasma coldseepsis]